MTHGRAGHVDDRRVSSVVALPADEVGRKEEPDHAVNWKYMPDVGDLQERLPRQGNRSEQGRDLPAVCALQASRELDAQDPDEVGAANRLPPPNSSWSRIAAAP